jgi:hypothetical protein
MVISRAMSFEFVTYDIETLPPGRDGEKRAFYFNTLMSENG